jgi:hypothetical protein
MNMIFREHLINDYLDYVNNYLTIGKYAEHRGLTVYEASRLVELGRSIYESKHPEA